MGNKYQEKPRKDLTDRKFERLKVLEFYEWRRSKGKTQNRRAMWLCECDCGKIKVIDQTALTSGLTLSCGCYSKDKSSEIGLTIYKENGSLLALYRQYKKGARERNILFDIMLEDFEKLTSSNCYYDGTPPSNIRRKQAKKNPLCTDYMYSGLDRLDPNKDYTIDNVVPCCSLCNYMKWTSTEEEFYKRMIRILLYKNKLKGLQYCNDLIKEQL